MPSGVLAAGSVPSLTPQRRPCPSNRRTGLPRAQIGPPGHPSGAAEANQNDDVSKAADRIDSIENPAGI